VVDGRRYQYRPVNLGFTVQAGRTLFLTVIHEAHAMNVADFIGAMGEIQRRAMAHKLAAAEMTGATVAFSSMARWNVSRHVPILPPRTSLIVAHAASRGSNTAVLGASYDHRLLSGHDVVQVLQLLARPPRQHTEEQA
jgi:pyruvate/2-oxoglutarate dehydrogenase complex dihydrolipoamide acyltransferase (E2) component